MQKHCNTQQFWVPESLWFTLNKIPRVMKLYIFLLCCSIGLAQATNSYAQKATVSLNMQNQTVQSVLDEIENQSEFSFFFNTRHVDLNRRVSVDTDKSDIFKVLDNIFAGTNVRYSVVDKKIILSVESKEIRQANQDKKITGVVKDQHGEPVIGANVSVKGTTIGTITGIDGDFTLEVPANAVIQVSYIGYVSQELRLEGKAHLDVMLKEDSQALEEVVVVGYGTMKKSDLTGSISTISAKDFNKGISSTPDQLLSGKIPGLMVNRSSGDPNSSATMQLRGPSSLTASTAPFYVIDGVPGASIDLVSPDDIESMNVLKDASATAIYGSRAANGVIMVTTRKGRTGKPQVHYSGYAAIESVSGRVNVLDAEEHRAF